MPLMISDEYTAKLYSHVKTGNSLFSVYDLIVESLQHDFHMLALYNTKINVCIYVDAVRGKGMLQK